MLLVLCHQHAADWGGGSARRSPRPPRRSTQKYWSHSFRMHLREGARDPVGSVEPLPRRSSRRSQLRPSAGGTPIQGSSNGSSSTRPGPPNVAPDDTEMRRMLSSQAKRYGYLPYKPSADRKLAIPYTAPWRVVQQLSGTLCMRFAWRATGASQPKTITVSLKPVEALPRGGTSSTTGPTLILAST